MGNKPSELNWRPPVLTGWLDKQGGLVPSWRRRWFVLENQRLDYYTDETRKVHKGGVNLAEKGTLVLLSRPDAAEAAGTTLSFEICQPVTSKRDYLLRTDCNSNLQMWLRTVQCACRPLWVQDVDCVQCSDPRCGSSFGIFNRKHHCRNCGMPFCADHSDKAIPLPHMHYEDYVRVCDGCLAEVAPILLEKGFSSRRRQAYSVDETPGR